MGREREQLLDRLKGDGYDDGEITEAEASGRLAALAVERTLGGEQCHTLSDLARESGLPSQYLREVMQAVGRPNPQRGERAFTDDDVEAAKLIKRFVDAGLPRDEIVDVGRVLSQGMAQVAEAVRQMAGNTLLQQGDSEYRVGLRFAAAADELAPLVPELLAYHFRAHLRDGVRRQAITRAELEAGRLEGTEEVAIAFADLVDYTRLGEQLAPEDVGAIATRFAGLAVKAVKHPVRLIKTIGDAAMFVSPDVPAMIATLRALVVAVEKEGESFPGVRVGVAHGPATAVGGDWFGSCVNLASRVTGAAKPGRILATEAVRDEVEDEDWRRVLRPRRLKGVEERVKLYSLDPEKS
jgi:adenylate cyclase